MWGPPGPPPGDVKVTLKTVDTHRCREKPSRSFLYLTKNRNFWERNYHKFPFPQEFYGQEEDGRDHLHLHKHTLPQILSPPVYSPGNPFVPPIKASSLPLSFPNFSHLESYFLCKFPHEYILWVGVFSSSSSSIFCQFNDVLAPGH